MKSILSLSKQLAVVVCAMCLVACASNSGNKKSKSNKLVSMVNEAEHFYKLGMLSDAEGKYRTILKKHPDYYQAWLKLGNIFIRTDQLDAAIIAYKACGKRAPEDVRCWNNLALARVKQAVHTLEKGKGTANKGTQEHHELDQFQRKLIKVLSSG